MIDIKKIENETIKIKENLGKRNFDLKILDDLIKLNQDRKELVAKVDSRRAQVNKLSQDVGMLKKKGENADALMGEVLSIKKSMEEDLVELAHIEEKQTYLLDRIPNLMSDEVPFGKDESANLEVRKWGTPKTFSFPVKDHADLGVDLGILDFEIAAKLTGSRFAVLKGDLAKLERALYNYMLDYLSEKGFLEILPPYLVHERALYGTGQLPKFKEDLFKIEGMDWYLIPTSEVPLTNLKREEIFEATQFPVKYTALTPCFRSEAGSYGRDTKGLIRMHQFNKVEMVAIVHPDDSERMHQEMVTHAQNILESLELPYRTVMLCSGDIGFGAQKTYDLEVWLPSQKTYREISSVSNCGDFQARRAGIRFKENVSKPQFAHTLNGSGLAVGRTLLAIMENYQNEDGTIAVPSILQKYLGGKKVLQ